MVVTVAGGWDWGFGAVLELGRLGIYRATYLLSYLLIRVRIGIRGAIGKLAVRW